MTSSLVGSEMCIRDSRKRGKQRRLLAGESSGTAVYPVRGAHALATARSCLLYTSEAADDM
eukprot:8693155-Prorocentrum_lima.AAC.1